MSNTVAAVATPDGIGAIGVIRISGDDAINIAAQCFRPVNESKQLTEMSGYTAAYGHIFDNDGDIDDAVATVFRAPHSYTGENTVELSLHGGRAVMTRALRAVYSCGADAAGRGEFTKRAFLNGKLSLTEAEAVMDVINAESSAALRSANNIKNGAVYKKISRLKEQLTFCAASVAAYVDFPEEGVADERDTELTEPIINAADEIKQLIDSFDCGRMIKNGVDCVIAGQPNVGKSTLLNALSGRERSIVTSTAGTTRDIIEETVSVDGVEFRLADTAGIHNGNDEIERIGITLARERIKTAQLVLFVVSAENALTDEDIEMIHSAENAPYILVVNKSDIGEYNDAERLEQYGDVVYISAKNDENTDMLRKLMLKKCRIGHINQADLIIANERQLTAAKKAYDALMIAKDELINGQTLDAVAMLIDDAIAALMELTGENVSESVISEVFKNFCVGK